MSLFTRVPGQVSPVDLLDNIDQLCDSIESIAYLAATSDAEAKDVGRILNSLVIHANEVKQLAEILNKKTSTSDLTQHH